jgi:hypothetical protein
MHIDKMIRRPIMHIDKLLQPSVGADLSALGGCDDVRIKKVICITWDHPLLTWYDN